MGDREGMLRAERSVMADPGVLTMNVEPPNGRKYWLEKNMLPAGRLGQIKPTFKIGEVAKTFFARSPDWLRWLGHQQEEGTQGSVLEVSRTKAGSRIYDLVDVERIAHTLLEHKRISVRQFVGAISIIRWMAYSYGILNEKDMVPSEGKDPANGQQVIPGVDQQIKEALVRGGQCEACQRGQCQNCETAAVLAEAAWRGETVYQLGDACTCYTANEAKHQ